MRFFSLESLWNIFRSQKICADFIYLDIPMSETFHVECPPRHEKILHQFRTFFIQEFRGISIRPCLASLAQALSTKKLKQHKIFFIIHFLFVLIIMFVFMLANYVMLLSWTFIFLSYIMSELPIVLHFFETFCCAPKSHDLRARFGIHFS